MQERGHASEAKRPLDVRAHRLRGARATCNAALRTGGSYKWTPIDHRFYAEVMDT